MGRAPCCAKEGLRKGPWSAKEDLLLTNYIKENGEGQWRNLPKNAGRTDNEIKNYWNTHLIKKLKIAGIQPKVTKKEPKKKPKTEKPRKKQDKKKKKKKKKKEQPLVQNTSDDTSQVVFVPKPIRISSRPLRNFSLEDVALLSTSCSDSPKMLSHAYQIIQKLTISEERDTHLSAFLKSPGNIASPSDSSEEVDNNKKINIITNDDDNMEGKIEEVSFIPCASNLLFDEVLLDGFCDLSDESMLEKVYEEYLQLISEKCNHQDDPMLM
ncbi:hypothetical protein RND71_019048 [Anisodus tanguticus]|uniref:Uncharacterized protein n=1 Tax=Anisodus tanguticus TaxID=243964 RepID=A0AAE1S5Y6_9SOLA|nr:hypothetical protein RND71_019048 [Anisodus tanguticus]